MSPFQLKILRSLALAVSPRIEVIQSLDHKDQVYLTYKGKEMGSLYTYKEAIVFLRGLDWGMVRCKTRRKQLVRYILGKDKNGNYKFNKNLMYPLHVLKGTVKMKV